MSERKNSGQYGNDVLAPLLEQQHRVREATHARRAKWARLMRGFSLLLFFGYCMFLVYVFVTRGEIEPYMIIVGLSAGLAMYQWRRAA